MKSIISAVKSKFTYFKLLDDFIFAILLLMMWVLMAGSTSNVDYNNYLLFYDFYSVNTLNLEMFPGVEIGFSLLMKLTNLLGMSYNGFLGVYALIGLYLLGNSIIKYSEIKSIPLILYFSYQYFLDAVQIRNFLALACFIFSVRYLVEYMTFNKKISLYKYVLGVLIASLFHLTSLYYLLFIFIVKFNEKKMIVTLSVVTLTSIILRAPLLNLATNLLDDTKYIAYLSNPTEIYGVIFYIIYIYSSIFIVSRIRSRIKQKNGSDLFVSVLTDLTVKINIVMIITIFLFTIRPDFVRLYRNILVLNYILLSLSLKPDKISLNKNNLLTSFLFAIFFLVSSYVFLWFSNIQGMVWPLLTNNQYFL